MSSAWLNNNSLDGEVDNPINVGRGDPDVSSKQRRRKNMTYRAAEPKRKENNDKVTKDPRKIRKN